MKSSAPTYRRADTSGLALRHGSGLLALVARHIATAAGKGGIRPYPAIDAKTVIYAVGDVHGRADLLMRVHEAMEKDWRARPAERRLEVYLGDYVDRGPDSASVIAMLRARSRTSRIMPLLGNHEEVLLRFLDGRLSDREWLDWGGAATALSYGINPSREAILNAALSRAIPLDDIRFLRALRPSFRYGPYFFAHAGVLPNRALEDQGRDDLLWIRRPFLDHKGNFGAVVVHGHTPNAEPEFKSNRINLDTGAYATHRLSCLRIDATGAALIGG